MNFEAVFLYLYDVGRSVDTKAFSKGKQLPGTTWGPSGQPSYGRRLDTPESLQLPKALAISLGSHQLEPTDPSSGGFSWVQTQAKIYDEGVIAIEVRAGLTIDVPELHTVRSRKISMGGSSDTIDEMAARHFAILKKGLGPYIEEDSFYFDNQAREDYHIFCLVDPVSDPAGFIQEHRAYLAPFLLGEDPSILLHESQMASTLKTPFSFTGSDVAIFDMDRAFMIAPTGTFDDLLLIIEHANYQLLELRTLDNLLDRLLDDAERDVRSRSRKKRSPALIRGSLSQKLEKLQPVRLDALFILENLENSSRIIGDYYLEQIYVHLCSIFNTQGWKRNVERRLEILQSIYSLTKSDANDKVLITLELLVVLMIAFEIFTIFVPIVH